MQNWIRVKLKKVNWQRKSTSGDLMMPFVTKCRSEFRKSEAHSHKVLVNTWPYSQNGAQKNPR